MFVIYVNESKYLCALVEARGGYQEPPSIMSVLFL